MALPERHLLLLVCYPGKSSLIRDSWQEYEAVCFYLAILGQECKAGERLGKLW